MAGLLVPSATALVLPSAVPSLVAPAAASELQAAAAALNEPGVKLTYDGPIMDYDGSLRYPISGAEIVSPSGVLLLFGALATRCGGLLPDEMPFNLVQKVLRGRSRASGGAYDTVAAATVFGDFADAFCSHQWVEPCLRVGRHVIIGAAAAAERPSHEHSFSEV